mgnify:FL=1|tara:strand:- start:433 stop:621 length:189 start_codon:yes stop_codon:yes gene_type:complete
MKNPFLSMWLSNANRALGIGRSAVAAEMRRQQNTATKAAVQSVGAKKAAGSKKSTTTKRKAK